jgi:large subunit ribosomal protein L25
MADTIVLEATRRDLTGKQVKQLRAKGLIPAVLYGPHFESVPLTVEWALLRTALLQAGGSRLIQLRVDGEEHSALVRRVQREPIRGAVLHVDFYRVRMDEVFRTEVPVVLVGDESAIETAGGVINHEITKVEIECLPGNLPEHIVVDVSALKEVGEHILASALPPLPGVTYHIEPDQVVVSTTYLTRIEEEEEEAEAPAVEVAEPELVRRRREEEEEEDGEEV